MVQVKAYLTQREHTRGEEKILRSAQYKRKMSSGKKRKVVTHCRGLGEQKGELEKSAESKKTPETSKV